MRNATAHGLLALTPFAPRENLDDPVVASALAELSVARVSVRESSWLSQQMHAAQVFRKVDAQHRFHTKLRERFGLAAQPFDARRANIAAGTCGIGPASQD
jgi:hypothetical protein